MGGGVGKGMISDLKRGLLNENRKKACSVAKKKEEGEGCWSAIVYFFLAEVHNPGTTWKLKKQWIDNSIGRFASV